MTRTAAYVGVLLLAPDSRGATWDALPAAQGAFGPDVAFLRGALSQVLSLYRVDPAALAIQGFSDGATYALGLGAAAAACLPCSAPPRAHRGVLFSLYPHGQTRGGVLQRCRHDERAAVQEAHGEQPRRHHCATRAGAAAHLHLSRAAGHHLPHRPGWQCGAALLPLRPALCQHRVPCPLAGDTAGFTPVEAKQALRRDPTMRRTPAT